jgi:hypothetical protein
MIVFAPYKKLRSPALLACGPPGYLRVGTKSAGAVWQFVGWCSVDWLFLCYCSLAPITWGLVHPWEWFWFHQDWSWRLYFLYFFILAPAITAFLKQVFRQSFANRNSLSQRDKSQGALAVGSNQLDPGHQAA